jgi:hypothetical protein
MEMFCVQGTEKRPLLSVTVKMNASISIEPSALKEYSPLVDACLCLSPATTNNSNWASD